MSHIRWLILILGPLPIVGSSWALSAWLKAEPDSGALRNDVVALAAADLPAPAAQEKPAPQPVTLGSERTQRVVNRPASAPAEASRTDRSPSDLTQACAQAAAKLEKTLGPECRVLARPPFVVAGDMEPTDLEAVYDSSIVPAARAMWNSYFVTQPDQCVTVLLFRTEQSYNRYCEKLFGDGRISVYGYYKPQVRTLVLNLGTGAGTLVHELTHALVDFDFPDVPQWFNEGLASMHEQCRFREGQRGPWIEGLVNWRLKGLQQTIRQKRLRSLESLVDTGDFRGPLEGTNYAQARYFCMYMQRRGVLEEFYRTFRTDRAHDPRGHESVAKVFSKMTWAELDRDFQRWVLDLAEPQ